MSKSSVREPSCIHDRNQPASMCIVCRDSDELREWVEWWAEYRAAHDLVER